MPNYPTTIDKDQEKATLSILSDPLRWAETLLYNPNKPGEPFKAHWYQATHFLKKDIPRRVTTRACRSSGKSLGVAALLLWYVFTHEGKRAAVIGPGRSHVDRVFEHLRNFIESSEILKSSVETNTKNPHMISLSNGSQILGTCTGTASKRAAEGVRGQHPHFIYIDEADRLLKEDWTAISPLFHTKPPDWDEEPIVWMTTTPTGKRERFWEIDTNFNGLGKDWTSWHFPISQDPRYTPEELEKKREEVVETEWIHELMAEYGEESEGVVKKEFIDRAKARGLHERLRYKTDGIIRGPLRGMGVDWDKFEATPNICVVELDPKDRQTYRVIYREDVPFTKHTLGYAVGRVVKLNAVFGPHYIYVDRGYGERQVEELHERGLSNVRGISYNNVLKHYDTVTREVVPKPLKNVMVNAMQWLFERDLVILAPEDRALLSQLEKYRVKRIAESGMPVFVDKEDHAVCSLMMALWALVENFNNPYTRRTEGVVPRFATINYGKSDIIPSAPLELKKRKDADPYEEERRPKPITFSVLNRGPVSLDRGLSDGPPSRTMF